MGRSLSTAEMTTSLILSVLALFSVAMSSPWNKNWSKEDFEKEWNKEYETPDFAVVASHEFYEERLYPGATWACTNMSVDTAEDPLAGLEGKNFLQIMNSRRYKTKVPSSQLFYNLFDYINGENEGSVKIKSSRCLGRVALQKLKHVSAGSSNCCHLGNDWNVMNDKCNFVLLIACQCLSMSKQTKSGNVSCSMGIVLVHQSSNRSVQSCH